MKTYLKSLAKKSISLIANIVAEEWVAGQLQLTPVLAEFPKSGGSIIFTVLNFIVANYGELCVPSPHIYSCTNYGVDLDRARSQLALASALYARNHCPIGVIKTHSLFRNEFRYAICLYREPMAVMRSYYRYLQSKGTNYYKDLAELLCCQERGIPAWISFYNSYINAPKACHLYFCQFELFASSPILFFDSILKVVYGVTLKEESHSLIASMSNIEYGKHYEDLVIQADPRKSSKIRFIGSSSFIPGSSAQIPIELQKECEKIFAMLRTSLDDSLNASTFTKAQ